MLYTGGVLNRFWPNVQLNTRFCRPRRGVWSYIEQDSAAARRSICLEPVGGQEMCAVGVHDYAVGLDWDCILSLVGSRRVSMACVSRQADSAFLLVSEGEESECSRLAILQFRVDNTMLRLLQRLCIGRQRLKVSRGMRSSDRGTCCSSRLCTCR